MTQRVPSLRVRLGNESSWPRLPRGLVVGLARDAYARHAPAPAPNAAVNVLAVDDAAIARYNRRFKRHVGPTDVLAFADGDRDPRAGRLALGDVVVSVETAAREAEGRRAAAPGWTARHELALYALHGVLHLLGFDDGDESDAAAMRRAQTDAFARLNLPAPPY